MVSGQTSSGAVLIELNDIRRQYGGTDGAPPVTVLHGISLRIRVGEFVAIVGASGSGKSTLMHILGCLDKPTSGTYHFAGINVARLDPDSLAMLRREAFGFVFQGYHLIPTLDVMSNVLVPSVYAGTQTETAMARAIRLLARLGLTQRVANRPRQLSGGQQQRVSIARALMNGGHVILADEPTGALDSHSGAEVMKLLNELADAGHTVILITHDQKVADRARRVVRIHDGRVVEDSGECVPPPVLSHPLGRAGKVEAAERAVMAGKTVTAGQTVTVGKAATAGQTVTAGQTSTAGQTRTAGQTMTGGAAGSAGSPKPASSSASSIEATMRRLRRAARTPVPWWRGLGAQMQSAWRGLWVSRLKTMLTLLSFVIGVSAVIVLVAIGQGNNDRTLKQLAAYGTHRMYVVPDVDEVTGRLGTLYETDVETVLGVPNVTLAMPFLQRDGVLRAGGHSRQMEVWSVNEYAQDLLNWRVARGMFFTKADEQSMAAVVVLGKVARERLFPDIPAADAIGQYVQLNGLPFRVIGEMAEKSSISGEPKDDDVALIPYSTGSLRVFGQRDLSTISVQIHRLDQMNQTAADIEAALKEARHTKDFYISNNAAAVKSNEEAMQRQTMVLALIAGISLLVGGLGVMNVMLMSVKERTREIGIRMAIGARQRDIQRQFLSEAAVVSLVGGAGGVLIGILIGMFLIAWDVAVIFSVRSILLAFGCALATGLLFGLMPARQAARLDPVVALGSE